MFHFSDRSQNGVAASIVLRNRRRSVVDDTMTNAVNSGHVSLVLFCLFCFVCFVLVFCFFIVSMNQILVNLFYQLLVNIFFLFSKARAGDDVGWAYQRRRDGTFHAIVCDIQVKFLIERKINAFICEGVVFSQSFCSEI